MSLYKRRYFRWQPMPEPTQFTEYRVVGDDPSFSEPMGIGGPTIESIAREWLKVCIRDRPERNPRLQVRTRTLSEWEAAEHPTGEPER